MKKIVDRALNAHKEALGVFAAEVDTLMAIAKIFIASINAGGKIIFCGNGGSAADSQHLAAEFIGRFKKEKEPLAAIALSVNTSVLTSIGNDYGFDNIFSLQISALAGKEDVLVGISTSGNSKNLVNAIIRAKELGITTVGFLGNDGGKLKELVDIPFLINMADTARVQEMHILAGHVLCELVEENFCEASELLISDRGKGGLQ